MIDLKRYICDLCDVAKELENQELLQLSYFLRQRIYQPDSYVVFLGETCSGKSTVINGMIGRNILPVSGIPSTGAITEVFIDNAAVEEKYAAINKNATMEYLTYEQFCVSALKPNPELQRLRATLSVPNVSMVGIRLFDTPGYGSLIAEHDEVLMDFLPNCDAIVYTVLYKAGIQESDCEFLRKLRELSRSNIPIYLAINRCPVKATIEDPRVQEIYSSVSAILKTDDLPLYIIPQTTNARKGLPDAIILGLRDRIVQDMNSSARRQELYEAFLSYLSDLILLIKVEIERKLRNLQMDAEDVRYMKKETDELAEKFHRAIDEIVKPGFQRISMELPEQVSQCRGQIQTNVCSEIEKQSVVSKDETIEYTKRHLLPYHAREKSKDIQKYLLKELATMDEQVNDYLNTVVINFERDIELHFASEAFRAGMSVAKGTAGQLLNTGLIKYFCKYGGRGGPSAGIANAASHALKKFGALFGKKFSRGTHNALKFGLKKIGLTSAKTLSAVISGILELAFIAMDGVTWKSRLVSQVKKGMDTWERETCELILEDMDKLKKANIEDITLVAQQYADAYRVDEVPDGDIEKLTELLKSVETMEEVCHCD